MAVIKLADFDNLIAANTWIELNKNFVQVLEFKNVIDDFGYPTSARLKRPRVILRYLDFREEAVQSIPDNVLTFDGYYLVYETGEYITYG